MKIIVKYNKLKMIVHTLKHENKNIFFFFITKRIVSTLILNY